MNSQETQIPLYERIPDNGEVADWLAVGTLNGVVKRQLMRDNLIYVGDEGQMIMHDQQTVSYKINKEIAAQVFPENNEDLELTIKLPNLNHRQNQTKGEQRGVNYMDRNGIELSFRSNGHNIYSCELYPATADKKVKNIKEEDWIPLTSREVQSLIKLIEMGIEAN